MVLIMQGFFFTLCVSGTRSISDHTGTTGTPLVMSMHWNDSETQGPSTQQSLHHSSDGNSSGEQYSLGNFQSDVMSNRNTGSQ